MTVCNVIFTSFVLIFLVVAVMCIVKYEVTGDIKWEILAILSVLISVISMIMSNRIDLDTNLHILDNKLDEITKELKCKR